MSLIGYQDTSAFGIGALPRDRSRRWSGIDSAKGVGILLVVFGHAWRGAAGAGALPDTALYHAVDFAVYAFHMPLFFFLSGLIFLEALERLTLRGFLRSRVERLLWPMALWSWIFFGLKLVAGQATNTPVTLSDFPVIPLPPFEHLWFLWALFVIQCLALGIALLSGRLRPFLSVPALAGGLAVALALINPYLSVPSVMWGPTVEHLPYFLAGITAGVWAGWRASAPVTVGALVVFVLLLVASFGHKATVMQSLGLVVAGWMCWTAVDRNRAEAGGILKALRRIGQLSMTIYLTHTIFGAALRIALLRLGVDAPAALVIGATLVGVLLPFAVYAIARRLGAVRLLGF